jgi:hypothetical protein
MTSFYGEELFEMYLLEHPEEQQHTRMVNLPDEDEPQVACQGPMMYRWVAWLLQNGHITSEKHAEATTMLRKAEAHAKAQK